MNGIYCLIFQQFHNILLNKMGWIYLNTIMLCIKIYNIPFHLEISHTFSPVKRIFIFILWSSSSNNFYLNIFFISLNSSRNLYLYKTDIFIRKIIIE